MSNQVQQLPALDSVVVLEMRSERLPAALLALQQAGFRVEHVINTNNQYRIQDSKEIAK